MKLFAELPVIVSFPDPSTARSKTVPRAMPILPVKPAKSENCSARMSMRAVLVKKLRSRVSSPP